MIHTRQLRKQFTSRKETVDAVKGVDIDIDPGELVAFLGPNGAGKTTTLRMLTTLLPPTSGTAEVAGADIVSQPALVRSRIGYIGQGNGGGHSFRVLDELHSQGRFYGLSTAEQTRQRAAELVASLDLTGLEKRTVGSLSGGQRRRLDVALGSDELAEAAVPGRAVDRDGPAEPGQPVGAHPRSCGPSSAPRSC